MKRILITGANSYIGTSFETYMKQWPDEFTIDTVDMIDGTWREVSFVGYDAVFHVAGIAHQKETDENAPLYFKVNRDLAAEALEKAIQDNVKQFVFLSSMSVYGLVEGVITPKTVPAPVSNYGKSKLQAEELLLEKGKDKINLAIIRPPMVYGEGCKGNYKLLCEFAKKGFVFPDYKNKRSMISIENLVDYIKDIITEDKSGFFYPQDTEYICTSEMIKKLANNYGRKIWFTRLFNPAIKTLRFGIIKKVFGNLTYENMEKK